MATSCQQEGDHASVAGKYFDTLEHWRVGLPRALGGRQAGHVMFLRLDQAGLAPTMPAMIEPNLNHMRLALKQAKMAAAMKEVPVGAVIVQGTTLLAQAHNQVEMLHDPTAHAEILAITQAAAALGNWRLEDTVMYVTKEPCPMCAGAIVLARIPLVVWGLTDPLRGGAI